MSKMNILFSPPDITEEEIEEVVDTLKSGWITTGPKTKLFEQNIAKFCNTSKAVCLNSATACAEMALRVLGIGPGDEVITSAYTYTASASVVCHVGAKLVLVDTQKDSYEMDYEALEEAITEKTKAIIPVDIAGVICDYEKIYEIIERKKSLFQASSELQGKLGRIAVVADAAHAFGAMRDGKHCGEIADFTSFSFHAVKNLTTAEGGALVWRDIDGVDNDALYKQFMLLSLHGQSKDALAKTQLGAWEYDIVAPYFKCNMTVLQHYGENFVSSGHLYLVRVNGKTRQECNDIIIKMAERGIATNVHYKPLPMLTAYKSLGFDKADYPNACDLFENAITLPLHTKLTDEEVDYVIQNFKECIE